MAPPISVVIPCYNRGTLLKRAIDSALAQTPRPRDVIVDTWHLLMSGVADSRFALSLVARPVEANRPAILPQYE